MTPAQRAEADLAEYYRRQLESEHAALARHVAALEAQLEATKKENESLRHQLRIEADRAWGLVP